MKPALGPRYGTGSSGLRENSNFCMIPTKKRKYSIIARLSPGQERFPEIQVKYRIPNINTLYFYQSILDMYTNIKV